MVVNVHERINFFFHYLPRVTKKQKRLSTIVSIMTSMSVSMISGLLIAEGTEQEQYYKITLFRLQMKLIKVNI